MYIDVYINNYVTEWRRMRGGDGRALRREQTYMSPSIYRMHSGEL